MKILLILLNTFIMAIFYEVILPDFKLSDGGLIGLGLIGNYITEIKLSYIYLVLNIPILIWLFTVDKRLFKSSVIGMLSFSLFTFILNLLNLETSDVNALVAVFVSGVFLGFNFFILGKIKASFGGVSPIAIKLDEWGIIKMSKFYLITDVLVLILLLLTIGAENFFLSILFVFIQSKSIDVFDKINQVLDDYIHYSMSINNNTKLTFSLLLSIENHSDYLSMKLRTKTH